MRRLGVGYPSPTSGQLTWCGSLSAPIHPVSTGTDVLGAARLTNNAAELTVLLAPLTWRATLPGQVRVRIVSDSKVSLDLVEQRAWASTNVALVQQCRQVLKASRAFAPTAMTHTSSYHGISGNEIADAFANAAASGIASPEAVAHNDNDNDTLRKVPHPSNEGLASQARVKGS